MYRAELVFMVSANWMRKKYPVHYTAIIWGKTVSIVFGKLFQVRTKWISLCIQHFSVYGIWETLNIFMLCVLWQTEILDSIKTNPTTVRQIINQSYAYCCIHSRSRNTKQYSLGTYIPISNISLDITQNNKRWGNTVICSRVYRNIQQVLFHPTFLTYPHILILKSGYQKGMPPVL